jgi:hypothetical protein
VAAQLTDIDIPSESIPASSERFGVHFQGLFSGDFDGDDSQIKWPALILDTT